MLSTFTNAFWTANPRDFELDEGFSRSLSAKMRLKVESKRGDGCYSIPPTACGALEGMAVNGPHPDGDQRA